MCIGYLGGWQLKYFWNMFTPKILGKMDPIWLAHIFQMGWRFNHHQGKLCWFLVFMGRRWDFFEMPSWNYGEKKGCPMIVHFEIQCPMWMAFFFRSLDCWYLQLVFGNLKLGSHCFLSFWSILLVKRSFPWSKRTTNMYEWFMFCWKMGWCLKKQRPYLVFFFWNTHRINGMNGIFSYLKARNIPRNSHFQRLRRLQQLRFFFFSVPGYIRADV